VLALTVISERVDIGELNAQVTFVIAAPMLTVSVLCATHTFFCANSETICPDARGIAQETAV